MGRRNARSLPSFAAELVRLNVDVIVTEGTPGARSLKEATSTIPIVMARVGDPVGTGLVGSLARPGEISRGFPSLKLVINQRAAKAIGLDVPTTLLARADEVIE